ncbi:family 72 glycoside hydrolase [Cryphonectria parasitica EP155]|uniref:1,3-beta-glucanosyltransferase n=1 Tax=Cryphonectria parasitica (strain ATCC 38755 / EP155) TaxID=660469 RepID=A0A9P5CPM0_CRYP1|nr:family 72 glycoside hydrolase [Cryphonectria parasitica EP155]KAF3765321.1 family 72 glycoside hydrolase [Cryphonectria parasitica EP155]
MFLIKGVVYRLHSRTARDALVEDRLGDLERDVSLFKELGLNVLFVDFVDSTQDHGKAMKLLAEAGIYVVVGLPTAASTTDSAGTTTTFRPYSQQLLEDCFATVDCMSQYSNTLGLIVANGALSTIYSTAAAPMIKTVIRDIKKYMSTAAKTLDQRQLPIGYSASNGRLILKTTFDYFTAGEQEETVDFFCYANFNWCGESTMQLAGYDAELKTFNNSKIPIFFSQYGCNLGACGKRIFQETSAIYSSAMTAVFSGGIAYEFYDSLDNRSGHWGYGLVKEEVTAAGRGLTKLPDFESLKARLEGLETASQQTQNSPDLARVRSEPDRTPQDIPPISSHWRAGHALPYSLADWSGIRNKLDQKAWLEVRIEDIDEMDIGSRAKAIRA